VEDELEELRSEVRRLRDHEEIRQLLYRYARGVDRADVDIIRSVYATGGTDRHGQFDGPGEEFAQVVVDRAKTWAWDAVGNHHITNIYVEVRGDEARAETYFLGFHPHNHNGPVEMAVMSGRYIDHLVREEGRWGIRRRQVITDWSRNHFDGPPWQFVTPEHGKFLAGRRGRQDPSYDFFASG
jgi:hypothetical protein